MQDDVSLSNIVLHYFYKFFLLNFFLPKYQYIIKKQ